MQPAYSLFLVWASVAIASLASYSALDLAGRVTAARTEVRPFWLAGGAAIMGSGIWSMHFIGMLAFHLPVSIAYDVPLLTLSIVVAVLASAFALHVVAQPSVRLASLVLAAPVMGGAIAGMHYIGMAAMRMDAQVRWRPALVVASLVIAVSASFAALWLATRFRSDDSRRGKWGKAGAAVVMGIAIAGMHYTAMAAATFRGIAPGAHRAEGLVLATPELAVSVIALALLLLGMAAIIGLFDRKLALSTALAAENERLYRQAQSEIAERRRAEAALRVSEEALRRSHRMEAVGRLAGGVAHDFNNILTAIRGYSELLLEDTAPSDHRYADLEEIHHAATRAAALTHQLLAFSRKQVLQPQLLDLNRVVAGMETLLRQMIGEHITLTTVLDPRLPPVTADPGQMEQVIVNLAVNARDAMPGGGKLIIESRTMTLDLPRAMHEVELAPGRYVTLTARDTGCGMDERILPQIFEPFFTTKETGHGTGLGLSTAYGIIAQSGGSMSVTSALGSGTTFEIWLPATVGTPEAENTPLLAEQRVRSSGQTILLVEDETAVRLLCARVLERNGFTVLEAQDVRHALRLAAQHDSGIDLLLTDVVMPEMLGPELAERVNSLRPGIRVLFMSGYTREAITTHSALGPGTHLLEKPFTIAALLQKVGEVLDGPLSLFASGSELERRA